jgi:hypothetical protein
MEQLKPTACDDAVLLGSVLRTVYGIALAVGTAVSAEPALGMTLSLSNPDGATEDPVASAVGGTVTLVLPADGATVGAAPTAATVQLHLATDKTVAPSELKNTPPAGRVSTVN